MRQRSKNGLTEHSLQVAFFAAISYYDHPAVPLTLAVPNQAVAMLRSVAARTAFGKEGVRAGVPDILCLFPSRGFHGLAIEMKKPGGVLSQAQREFLNRLHRSGYSAGVCYSTEDALAVWKRYLGIPP